MERALSASNVRIVCLPLHSAPDQVQTWTYFVPSKKMNSTKVPWKSVGASGILLQPAVLGKKNSSCWNRTPMQKRNDSSPKKQYYYAKVLKKESNGTPAVQSVIDMALLTEKTIEEAPATQKLAQMQQNFHKNEEGDRLEASDKDKFMSLLSLVPTAHFQQNNPARQTTTRDPFLGLSTRSGSSSFSATEQSLQDNHHICAGAERNQKLSADKLPPKTAGPHERKGCGVVASSCRISRDRTDAINHSNSFSMRNTTASDLPSEHKETCYTDSVSKLLPEGVEFQSFSVSSDGCGQNEAKAEDYSSDELCIVSVRSLASEKDGEIATSQVEQEVTVPKPLDIRKLGQRLLLRPSPHDPSKRILYLHTDYSTAKPVSNMSPTLMDTDDYSHHSNTVKKSGKATKIRSAGTRRSRKLPRKRSVVKSEHTVPESRPNVFSKPREKSLKRAVSNDPEASAVRHEKLMVNDAVPKTREIVRKERQSTSAETGDSSLQKTNSRISQLRAMLRKKEADLEEVRKSLINFDDSMPG